MAFFDVGELAAYEIHSPEGILNLPKEARAGIAGWSYDRNDNFTLKLIDRSKTLDQLSRHLGLYNDRLTVNISEGLADRVRRAKARGVEFNELKKGDIW